MSLEERVFSHVGCLSLSRFDEISVAVFKAGRSLTKKGRTRKKKIVECIHFHGVDCWKSKRKRERVCYLCK